ncbi:MAG: hypothetical protein J5636_06465 [Clostridiales bacterium]|nr:hypothetical protein [Clostridiales bacterium]
MKTIYKILSLMVLVSIISCVSMPVNATTSTVYVGAGSSAYTAEFTQAYGNHSKCHMALQYVQFSGYAENSIPCSYYVYSRLYLKSPRTAASDCASFSQVNSSGYDYWFWDGYATNGQQFVLKTNSNLSVYYSAIFNFSASAD